MCDDEAFSRKGVVCLTAIVMLGLALRLSYRCGLCNPDSYAYAVGAIRMNGEGLSNYLSTISDIYENRISIVLPLALVIRVFGLSERSLMILPLLCSLGTIIVTHLLGKELSGNVLVALLAATLVAILPQDVLYSTAVLPDSVIPFYASLALLCYVLSRRRASSVFLVSSGFFIFCAFEARATSGVLLCAIILMGLWPSRRRIKRMLVPTVSFVAFILAFWITICLLGGTFLSQYEWLLLDATAEKYVGTGQVLAHFKESVTNPFGFGLFYVLAFAVLPLALHKARTHEAYRLPVVTFVTLYAFLEFGSTTVMRYRPIWKLSRFLTILTVPVALMLALVLVSVLRRSRYWVRLGAYSLLMLHLVLATGIILHSRALTRRVCDYNAPYRVTFEELSRRSGIGTVHVVNFRWSLRGKVYSRFHSQVYQYADLELLPSTALQEGDVVVYDPVFFTPLVEYSLDRTNYPAVAGLPESLPLNWQLLFTVDRPTHAEFPVYVYLVGSVGDPSPDAPLPCSSFSQQADHPYRLSR